MDGVRVAHGRWRLGSRQAATQGSLLLDCHLIPSCLLPEYMHTWQVEVGHADGPLHLASIRHGGVFGAEGALISLPSMYTTRVRRHDPSNTALQPTAAPPIDPTAASTLAATDAPAGPTGGPSRRSQPRPTESGRAQGRFHHS